MKPDTSNHRQERRSGEGTGGRVSTHASSSTDTHTHTPTHTVSRKYENDSRDRYVQLRRRRSQDGKNKLLTLTGLIIIKDISCILVMYRWLNVSISVIDLLNEPCKMSKMSIQAVRLKHLFSVCFVRSNCKHSKTSFLV